MQGKSPQDTDIQLIRRVLRGDREVYALLMQRYQGLVYTIAYRMTGHHEDAQDIAQECFLRAYAALPRFQIDQPFAPWISRIASNLCLNWIDRRKRERLTAPESLYQIPGDVESAVEDHELQAALQQAVLKLPPRYRLVFVLRYLEGYDCRKVAQIMEIPEGTVKTYLFRARRRLQKALRPFWHEE